MSDPLPESAGASAVEPEIAELPRADEAPRDGIGERDNAIPRWFNVCFLATIVFAVCYVPYYHFYLGWSAAQVESYLRNFAFRLGPDEEKGAAEFLRMRAQIGPAPC